MNWKFLSLPPCVVCVRASASEPLDSRWSTPLEVGPTRDLRRRRRLGFGAATSVDLRSKYSRIGRSSTTTTEEQEEQEDKRRRRFYASCLIISGSFFSAKSSLSAAILSVKSSISAAILSEEKKRKKERKIGVIGRNLLYQNSVKIGGIKLRIRSCTCSRVSPSTLLSGGKQGATAACKTCRGRPLVDGIRPSSAGMTGMTSTVGLELTNFLNPDLTWKKVSKGYRRNRKPVAKFLTAGVELADKSPRRAEDTTVSDSEKLGVAVLGRRFSDKMENVPIKKRKYNFRSPSPPPRTPSPHSKVAQHASGQGSSPNFSGKRVHLALDTSTASTVSPHGVEGKVLEAMNGKLDFREDFSGIEILAEAACSDSFDVNVDHTVENPVAEESACRENETPMLKEETGVSLETTNLSPNDTSVQDRVEESSVEDITPAVEQKSPILEDNKMVESSVSLSKDRSFWDLNVVMDDWQQPSDIVNVEANTVEGDSKDKSEKLNPLKNGETERETVETDFVKDDDMVNKLVSSEVHGKTDAHSDSRGSSFGSNRQDNHLEACSGLDHNHDECGVDGKPSAQVVRIDQCLSNGPYPSNMESSTSPPSLEEKTKTGLIDRIACVENVQVEEQHDVASPYVPALDGVTHEVDSTALKVDDEDSARASSLNNETSVPQEVSSVENCKPSSTDSIKVEPVCEVEKADVSNVSLSCEDVSTSSAPVEEVQPIVAEEKNPLADEAFPSHTSEIDSSVHAGSEEVIHVSSGNLTATVEPVSGFTTQEDCIDYAPTKSLGEINNEDPNDEIRESDAAQNDKESVIGAENSRELQAGYDSQFEDGELRETDVRCWNENEGDSAEIEQVDYESECDGERLCVSEAEGSENKMKFESGSTQGFSDVTEKKIEECILGDASRDHLTSSKIRTLEATDGSKLKKDGVDCEDGANSKDFGSNAGYRRGLLSRTEGSLSSDTIPRSGSDNCEDLFPHSEREAASKSMEGDRSTMQMRCRSPGGGDGHIVNTRQLSNYDGFYGSGRPRPRSIVESRGRYVMASDCTISEATGVEGFENRVRRQYLSSSSNSVYRQFNRRSLAYRDDTNGIHGGAPHSNNPDRSRFRRYPQGVSRDFREDYHRPMYNYSTDHMPHRMARRERSISPVGGGRINYAQPYKKSRSRSRSRSPNSRLLLRERNEGRRRSRSPNFRPVRMDKVSLPFQKRFAADFEEGFISPPRKRFSPPHNSQFDDQIPDLDNFRSPNFRPVRMERMRMPFPKQHFAADYEEGFISPPRKRFSPQRNSQFDERIPTFRPPNFRPVRADRARLPFQKHFTADDEEGYISPPRKRFSPQNNSRFDDRMDNFRDRKSPVRNFRQQGQRYDRFPRRFPDMGGAGRGGGYNKYEGGGEDDRRKQGSRFDMIPRRRFDDTADGGVGGPGGSVGRRMTTEDE
ncbi:hypothetical protein QYF36_011551 [Acer negundo]|nr:hypothetical protein QYF36_011551 [Acer negundo]